MNKKLFKIITLITTPMFILALIYIFLTNNTFISEKIDLSKMYVLKEITMSKAREFGNDISSILGENEEATTAISDDAISDIRLYPGGSSIGVRLETEGVLVVGFSKIDSEVGEKESPAKESGIELGDIILKVNEENIENSRDLISKIKNCTSDNIMLTILRNNVKTNKNVKLLKEEENYKLGLWVRDSTAGIGTLTFYNEKMKVFGALGHPITDGDTNSTFLIKQGDLLKSSVLSVRRGEKGTPGELKGLFQNDYEPIGSILRNTISGIYGEMFDEMINPLCNKPLEIGLRGDIKEGPATIYTTIDSEGIKEYDIEIVKILEQNKPGPKSMVIRVTDEELLSKTGGIVQGMSGSPIIQDNKIIGAITHVLINKPDLGYGIYIEWMLKDAGILE